MTIQALAITLSVLALLTYGISFIKGILRFRKGIDKPNERQDLKIALLDKDITNIKEGIHDIKVNHLEHIEKDVSQLKVNVGEIKGILLRK